MSGRRSTASRPNPTQPKTTMAMNSTTTVTGRRMENSTMRIRGRRRVAAGGGARSGRAALPARPGPTGPPAAGEEPLDLLFRKTALAQPLPDAFEFLLRPLRRFLGRGRRRGRRRRRGGGRFRFGRFLGSGDRGRGPRGRRRFGRGGALRRTRSGGLGAAARDVGVHPGFDLRFGQPGPPHALADALEALRRQGVGGGRRRGSGRRR